MFRQVLDLRKLLIIFWAPLVSGSLLFSCSTYYEINNEFNRNFELGNPAAADQVLADDRKASKGKDRLLYYLNRGVVNSMIGNYELSNEFFEKAYLFSEDFQKNYFRQAASYLTNPNVIAYSGEDHEILLLHYYKALNYLKLKDPDAALVECRRMDIKLRQLGDRYRSDKKYQRDAFINTLMGIIYDSDRDYNNAFIAYRNAYNIYQEDYGRLFNLDPPEQLKLDLMRTAFLTGFYDELEFYEKEFGTKYEHSYDESGDILFFWNNGLGPVKSEWSINFVIVKDEFGVVHFQNDEYGFNFPFPLNDYEDDDGTDLVEDLRVIRVAFPKYIEREVMFSRGYLETGGKEYPLHLTENINAIAFKTLEQRMLKEFSTGLIRFALKTTSSFCT